MKFSEFAKNINEVYREKFVKSACIVKPFKCCGNSIYIDCYLAGNLNEVAHGIAANDMFSISLLIDLPDNFDFNSDELPENLIMKAQSNSYVIKPDNEYLYCNYKKVPYRKTKGTAEKLIDVFKKFVDKLHNQVIEDLNAGNIHENFKVLVEKKV